MTNEQEAKMNHAAPTEQPIHELLRQRWSPYAFDPNRPINEADLQAMFEAARWTMSSYNAQPWRYVVGVREHNSALWDQVLSVLVEGNQPWAKNAPVLALGVVEHQFEHNGKDNKAAVHDLGAASANLTFEATARGISVHQMIGIEPEKAREVFGLSVSLEPLTGFAMGYVGDPSVVGKDYAERDNKPRERKPIEDLIIRGAL